MKPIDKKCLECDTLLTEDNWYESSKKNKIYYCQPCRRDFANTVANPKLSDFKDKKNPFGGRNSKMDQYRKALKEYYKNEKTVSSMKKRDDRIFKNAIKGGVVQKEMLKQGYNNGI